MMSTAGSDKWSEDVIETTNYPTSINGGRNFKLETSIKSPNTHKWGETLQTPIKLPSTNIGGRHFEP